MHSADLRKRLTFGIFRTSITACQGVGILCAISGFPRDVDGTALCWVITQRIVVKITTTSCVIRNFQAYGNNPNKSKWYSYRNTSCLNEMNASCRSVQNLPSYSPLSANSKTKKCRNIIFGVVIHWRQIWYLTRR